MKKNDFMGRATRGEWWGLSILFSVIETVLTVFLVSIGAILIPVILSLVIVIPQIAVSVRRMHDLDKSGWWILVPVYGLILCAFVGGTSGRNKYGYGYDRAIANISKLIRAYPNDAEAYYNRGRAYAAQRDYTRATADYEQALRINPNYAEAQNSLTEALRLSSTPALGTYENPYDWSTQVLQIQNVDILIGSYVKTPSGNIRTVNSHEIEWAKSQRC
jgi:hypothetical protein